MKKYKVLFHFTFLSQIELLPRFSIMYGTCEVHGVAIEFLWFSLAVINEKE
jgi:hypothetical protein